MPQLTWLITGCSSGLGEAFARVLLTRGEKVIATARGDVDRFSSLAEAGAKTLSLDVTAPRADVDALVHGVLEEGPVDVLVNNAGYIEAGICEEVKHEDYVAQFETNFYGVVKLTQAILPHFRSRKAGSIVFIGSVGGIAGDPGAGPYCATKFALEGWYECLKLETAAFNIKCCMFELGFFRTGMMHPENVKFRGSRIADYDSMRSLVEQGVDAMNGTQRGDPAKAVSIIIDVVRGEGVAEGKMLPDRLPLGPDVLKKFRDRCTENLAIMSAWEDVIGSTDLVD